MADTISKATGGGASRGQWASRFGFILAAAGSAVGLGNIWKFPYITGHNGGGWFVLIYLLCIVLVGLPVMIGEIIIGRDTQRSPVPAFETLGGGKVMWSLVGWLAVATAFIGLSYYSIVAGWSLDYVVLAIGDSFSDKSPAEIKGMFGALSADFGKNVMWHAVFMALTIGIVIGGVHKGIERAATIMMPLLLLMMIGLMIYAVTLKGFGRAVEFVFAPNADNLTPGGVLEALGHAFFTLSVGMGALITYGSYLARKDDVVFAATAISIFDTFVALCACMIMFPIVFSAGLGDKAGPGLVFQSMPIAFAQIPGGVVLGVLFFALLTFAALTSAISLLEVVVATIIDKFNVSRKTATIAFGALIFLCGVPSGKADFTIAGKPFFFYPDFIVSNILLPVGGLSIAVFVGWVMPAARTYENFSAGKPRDRLYRIWLSLMRFFVPVAILLVLLYSTRGLTGLDSLF